MKMAKASEQDIEAAGELMALLNALSSGYHPSPNQTDDDDRQVYFDPEDRQHLRVLYDALDKILESAPGMPGRVIGGMCYVIMWDKNKIIDPDADTLEMHPIHVKNAMDAERYRLLRSGQKWSVIDGTGDALRAEVLDTAIDAAMEKKQ